MSGKRGISLFVVAGTVVLAGMGCEPEPNAANGEPADSGATAASAESPAAVEAQPAATSAGGAGLAISGIRWYGPNMSSATYDSRAVVHSASIDRGANVVRLSYDPLPSDWPKQVNAPGMLCLFEQLPDGSWRGGKFEWIDPGQTVKSLKNIDNGYNGWQRPANGARVAVAIFSTDGRRCSNIVYTTY